MAFIYVCMEAVNFSLALACEDSVEQVRYGVWYMYVGCGDRFVGDGSFILLIDLQFCLPKCQCML